MATEIANSNFYNVSTAYNVDSSFTLRTPLGVNTNLSVYEQAYQFQNTNYVVFINVGNMANLFTNASYQDFLNQVNVNITVNQAWAFENVFNTGASVLYRGGTGASENANGVEKLMYNNASGQNAVISTNRSLGFRLLEIAAVNIFNNAKARAAIANDTDFINGTVIDRSSSVPNSWIYNSLSNQLATAFNTDKFNIFNQYVNTSRYNTSVDSNQFVNFNFKNSNVQVLLTFNTNTVGTEGSYSGSIGGLSNGVSKTVLLILTDNYDFNNVQGAARHQA
jgi:hypothetical protein